MAGESRTQDINVPLIVTIGVIGTILLLVSVLGLQAWYRFEVNRELTEKVINTRNWELDQLANQQRANLEGWRYADPEQQYAQIPLERAMELVVREYADGRFGSENGQTP